MGKILVRILSDAELWLLAQSSTCLLITLNNRCDQRIDTAE